MKDTKIQWHPGFVGAMNLELWKNQDDLLFGKEYNLNTKPLEIDLLVIRKNMDIQIDNEIGKMFLGHNILEYKPPKEELDPAAHVWLASLSDQLDKRCTVKCNGIWLITPSFSPIVISRIIHRRILF